MYGPAIQIPRLRVLLDYKLAESSGVLTHRLHTFVSHWDAEIAKCAASIERGRRSLVWNQIRAAEALGTMIDHILDAEGGDYVRDIPDPPEIPDPPSPPSEEPADTTRQQPQPAQRGQHVDGTPILSLMHSIVICCVSPLTS